MKLVLATTAALALFPLSLSAATLTVTDVVGSWIDATGGTDVSGLDTDTLSWGIPANTMNRQSSYVFDGRESADNRANKRFVMGEFTHNNYFLTQDPSITAATLRVAFTFFIDAAPDTSFTRTAQFRFNHDETINDANPCANGEPNNVPGGVNVNDCADEVTVRTNPKYRETFEFDGAKYVFDVTGFAVGDSFWTTENRSNSTLMTGRFTEEQNVTPPSAVPLPAAGWMLVAALGLVGGLRARRRA